MLLRGTPSKKVWREYILFSLQPPLQLIGVKECSQFTIENAQLADNFWSPSVSHLLKLTLYSNVRVSK